MTTVDSNSDAIFPKAVTVGCVFNPDVPNMELPLCVYPPKVKTCEWSAVTTVMVSWTLVMRPAIPMARSISTAS